ncbi:hypothetical protein FBQ98_07030, partial [Gammaproteobacteria bacterium PRO6]|nr:hypothetical protein [Gammaproteobacteria bacterium PRO6]
MRQCHRQPTWIPQRSTSMRSRAPRTANPPRLPHRPRPPHPPRPRLLMPPPLRPLHRPRPRLLPPPPRPRTPTAGTLRPRLHQSSRPRMRPAN